MRARRCLLVTSAGVGAASLLVGCVGIRDNAALDRQVLTLISDDADWPPEAFFGLFELRSDSAEELQIVSVESDHSGQWKVRDRQLLANGTVAIADYRNL